MRHGRGSEANSCFRKGPVGMGPSPRVHALRMPLNNWDRLGAASLPYSMNSPLGNANSPYPCAPPQRRIRVMYISFLSLASRSPSSFSAHVLAAAPTMPSHPTGSEIAKTRPGRGGHDWPLISQESKNGQTVRWSVKTSSSPEGSRLRAATRPPHASTQLLTMASPRPTPPVSRVRAVSGRKNGSNNRGSASGGTPGPIIRHGHGNDFRAVVLPHGRRP